MLYEPSQNTIYSGYMSDSHTSRTGHLSKSLSKYRYAPQVKYEEGVQCDKSMSNSNKSMGQKIFNKLFQTKERQSEFPQSPDNIPRESDSDTLKDWSHSTNPQKTPENS